MNHVISVSPDSTISTLTQAIALLPTDETQPVIIRLAPGVYHEKLTLSRANTTLEGADSAYTRIVFDDGAKTLLPDGMKRGTFRTATLRVDAPHVTLRGLTIENNAAPREQVGQAIALYADGDGLLVEDCVLRGAQDTLFTAPLPPKEIEKNGFIGPKQFAPRVRQHQTYRRCRIFGDVDFLFGGASAWFEDCELVSIDGRFDRTAPYVGYVCAPSTPQGQALGYVFVRCRFTGEGVPPKSVYLARPWREWARVMLIFCELGAHIAPVGFDDWNKPLAHQTVVFAEYQSFGSGARGVRAPYARKLTDAQVNALTYEQFCQAPLEDA